MSSLACQLLVDPPKPGAWNMAADEAMLDAADQSAMATLRFYHWQEPTLSLGYFQRFAQRADHSASQETAVVRRLSGGGALVHDHELTYSIALPASHPLTQNQKSLYIFVHQALIRALHDHGIPARMHREQPSPRDQHGPPGSTSPSGHPANTPFLCFQRHCPGDVLMADSYGQPVKILGSAQRRRRGALLQHGSLLLAASLSAPELPGLYELTGGELGHSGLGQSELPGHFELMNSWCLYLKENVGLDLIPTHWSPERLQCIQQYLQTKYRCSSWIEAR
jgi:lipoate-protein ligase A